MCGTDMLITSKNPVTNQKQSLVRSRVGDPLPKPVNFGNALSIETQLTSNHFTATSNASMACLAVPSTLRTSSQHMNFFSRK